MGSFKCLKEVGQTVESMLMGYECYKNCPGVETGICVSRTTLGLFKTEGKMSFLITLPPPELYITICRQKSFLGRRCNQRVESSICPGFVLPSQESMVCGSLDEVTVCPVGSDTSGPLPHTSFLSKCDSEAGEIQGDQ